VFGNRQPSLILHSFMTIKIKEEEVTEWCIKLSNQQLYEMYFSLAVRMIKSRRMKLAGYVARMGEMSNIYKIVVGKSRRKKSLKRYTRWREYNMKMGVKAWTGFMFTYLRYRFIVGKPIKPTAALVSYFVRHWLHREMFQIDTVGLSLKTSAFLFINFCTVGSFLEEW
jgi:hypothetical protein